VKPRGAASGQHRPRSPNQSSAPVRSCGPGVTPGNVLIEIGAALALYRRRFILLVQNGAKLPSNLQGLFEVRYDGEKMDAEAALRLLKSLKDLKNQPVTRIA
jgi:hypothetical protein